MLSISVTNLGKAYKNYPTRWSRLAEWVFPFLGLRHQLTWVLQDINFSVQPGEALGIIGVNGAGKSTLLKMIAGTTQPTSGSVQVTGRVAALLELGMGFHPDFTGRQNCFMAGQLLGFSVSELAALMPEIEAFADIGDYIDQPVRIYSSGMQARLAFSVATCATPDVLIVDEALSVGDRAFQSKCMQRMNDLLESGVTVLFVSHSLNQVRKFCRKALYISNGRIKAFGSASEVCDLYQNDLAGGLRTSPSVSAVVQPEALNIPPTAVRDDDLRKHSVGGGAGGTLDLEFISFDVLNMAGDKISACDPGEKIYLKAGIIANKAVSEGTVVGLLIGDKSGYPLLSCNSNYYNTRLPKMLEGEVVAMIWSFEWPFYSGEFRIDIGLKPDPHSPDFYDRVFCAKTLVSTTPVSLLRENFGGYIHVQADVVTARVS